MNRRPPRRPRFRFAAPLIAALVVGLAGCATAPAPTAPVPTAKQWQGSELIQSLAQREKQFRSLRALARVDYAGPDGKHGFQEAVIVERPDRLRLETLSMLGAVMIVTVNNTEIIGYHVREGIMVRGNASKANLLRYTQIPLELHEITTLLLGLPPVNTSAQWRQQGNALIFSPGGEQTDRVAFESAEPAPTQWERLNGDGAVEVKASFGEYVSLPAGLFPSRLTVEAPLQKRKVEIRYQEPEVNVALAPDIFTQKKPGHVQELPIEALGG